jgi:hypothetical protein
VPVVAPGRVDVETSAHPATRTSWSTTARTGSTTRAPTTA